MKTIREEYWKISGILSLAMGVPGIILTFIPQPFLAGAGVMLLFWGIVSGMRAMFGGMLMQLMNNQNRFSRLQQDNDDPSTEFGRKGLVKMRRWRFIDTWLYFFLLIVSLSMLIIGGKGEAPAFQGCAAGSALSTAAFNMFSLYLALKAEQRLKGDDKSSRQGNPKKGGKK